MSILLTGFDPFDGAARNPSWETVSIVPEAVAGHAVHRLQLPTVFGMAAEMLREAIARIRPTIVICCGVANGRRALRRSWSRSTTAMPVSRTMRARCIRGSRSTPTARRPI